MQTDFPIIAAERIFHGKKIALLGSCFSENMAAYFRQAGFTVTSNPYGTIFHPQPLLAIFEEKPDNRLFVRRQDLLFSMQASGSLYGFSEQELESNLENARNSFLSDLKDTSMLIITLGSAHGYRDNTSGYLSANCHKLPASRFTKELTEIREIVSTMKRATDFLSSTYPQLQVVFTLSPVRYKRDGWIENQQSKARLLEAIHAVVAESKADYFPAYEFVIDILRDYSWFAEDGVHPNSAATERVFELFGDWFFDEPTKAIIEEGTEIRRMFSHTVKYPGSIEAQKFEEQATKKRESFLSRFPDFIW